MQVQQITLRGFRLLYKAGDIIRIPRWNVSTVARRHGTEYHDGKETISIVEVLLEQLILAKIINELPAFYKIETFPLPTTTVYCNIFLASLIHSTSEYPVPCQSIVLSFSNLFSRFPDCFLPFRFSDNKIL
jgi:hypothetical protein